MSASDKKKLRKEQENAALTEKQLSQQKEDKQLKTYTMTFIVVMILVVAIAVGSLGSTWYQNSGIPARTTTAVTINGYELSNIDLNYYYIDGINDFYSEMYDTYSSYTTLYAQIYYGLDMTTALNAQYYDEASGTTWADYFLQDAISYAEDTYALYAAAMEAGYELSEEYETYLNASLASAVSMAGYYGYSSFDDYLEAVYGTGANEESYVNYYRINATAEAFYYEYADKLTYTQDEIDTYNAEHYDEFSSFSYSYYYLNIKEYNSILEENAAEGETTEETDTYAIATDNAKADAEWLAKAPTVLIMNKTIAQFDISATKENPAATEIDDVTIGSVDSLYSEWLADPARQVGDTTIVEYESSTDDDEILDGYYVVLFEGRNNYEETMINVRHILIGFEGGTKDDDGNTVYSEEEKQAAYDEALALYNEWLAGEATEDSFAALVAENSDDSGSSSAGGLYENVYNGYMVEEFNDWCFDPARQSGDHDIIETQYGYHLMYFVGNTEQTYREYVIEYTLRSADLTEWYQDLLANVETVNGDDSYIYKALVIAPSST